MERPHGQILLVLLFAVLSPLSAETYTIAPAAGAELRLKVYKTGFMRGKVHDFVFMRYSGKIEFDAERDENFTVTIEIEANSLVCEDTWVSAKDLAKVVQEAKGIILDIERHPVITFRSLEMRSVGADRFEVDGKLTIRGRSEASRVLLTMKRTSADELRFDGESVVTLKTYGIKPPSAAFGAVGTKNEMDLSFRLVARRN
jgi:polyisoprenoid-binding protein YceI